MITIKNLRQEKPTKPYQVRVDRWSMLGNPFIMKNESERDIVCEKYQAWFELRLKLETLSSTLFTEKLNLLKELYKQYGKLELFCWCAPKRCHAETIKKYLEKEVTIDEVKRD